MLTQKSVSQAWDDIKHLKPLVWLIEVFFNTITGPFPGWALFPFGKKESQWDIWIMVNAICLIYAGIVTIIVGVIGDLIGPQGLLFCFVVFVLLKYAVFGIMLGAVRLFQKLPRE